MTRKRSLSVLVAVRWTVEDASSPWNGSWNGWPRNPVQSVLPVPSTVLSVQVKPREQATGPLVMRWSSVRFRSAAPS
jgi:hypothetical protein